MITLLATLIFLSIPQNLSAASDTLFQTGWGTGPNDKARYGEYTSEVLFTPTQTMRVRAVRPKVYSCRGECTYAVTVREHAGQSLVALTEKESRPRFIDGTLPHSITLRAEKTYLISTHIESEKGLVGIYTTGSSKYRGNRYYPNRKGEGEMELVSAHKGLKRFTERGSIAFSLYGETVLSRIDRAQMRREARLKRRRMQ